MLCSCNTHPRKEQASPVKKSTSPELKDTADLNPLEKLEKLEEQETAAVASMLKKVEWKNTPVYKMHFNEKITEAESLKGTKIGFRKYLEEMKTKGKTMGQIALDLKDEKLRKLVLD